MSDDIVTRLRRDCMSLIANEAADEMERLRVQALGTQRRIQDQDAIMAELWERIHALTDERDEARRMLCQFESRLDFQYGNIDPSRFGPVAIAAERGWDCFKEGG
jgi:hypothetical protein